MRFFETTYPIFLDDLDAIGVLHNSRYLLVFERALGAFWRHVGWKDILDYEANPDSLQVVRENRVEYLRPVMGEEEVRVRASLRKLGRTSLTFGFEMRSMDGDVLFARGTRVMVKIDAGTRRPSPITGAAKEMLRPWLDSDADSPGSLGSLRG